VLASFSPGRFAALVERYQKLRAFNTVETRDMASRRWTFESRPLSHRAHRAKTLSVSDSSRLANAILKADNARLD